MDKKFLENLMNSYFGWFVQDDLREGIELGVTDVPLFFYKRRPFLKKSEHLKTWRQIIKPLLAKKIPGIGKATEKKRA